jgi:hypothetical protein
MRPLGTVCEKSQNREFEKPLKRKKLDIKFGIVMGITNPTLERHVHDLGWCGTQLDYWKHKIKWQQNDRAKFVVEEMCTYSCSEFGISYI